MWVYLSNTKQIGTYLWGHPFAFEICSFTLTSRHISAITHLFVSACIWILLNSAILAWHLFCIACFTECTLEKSTKHVSIFFLIRIILDFLPFSGTLPPMQHLALHALGKSEANVALLTPGKCEKSMYSLTWTLEIFYRTRTPRQIFHYGILLLSLFYWASSWPYNFTLSYFLESVPSVFRCETY